MRGGISDIGEPVQVVIAKLGKSPSGTEHAETIAIGIVGVMSIDGIRPSIAIKMLALNLDSPISMSTIQLGNGTIHQIADDKFGRIRMIRAVDLLGGAAGLEGG